MQFEFSMARSTVILMAAGIFAGSAQGSTPQPPDQGIAVHSKGLRGRIADGKLRPAKLVFTAESVTAELRSEEPEEFKFLDLKIMRGSHYMGLPIFSKWYWLQLLPSVAVATAIDGLSGGAEHLVLSVGAGLAVDLVRRLRKRHESHWVSLHAKSEHRCVFLALPRKRKLRQAIFSELERRDPTKLRTRPPLPAARPGIPPHPLLGVPAPDFELASLDGPRWRLSEAAGKVVLLNFWETWCGPCRMELPHLQRIHQRFSAAGLVVVGVSSEHPTETLLYLRDNSITYNALSDVHNQASGLYHVDAIPTTFIIGRDGTLRERVEGFTKEGTFARAVMPHLAAPAVPAAP